VSGGVSGTRHRNASTGMDAITACMAGAGPFYVRVTTGWVAWDGTITDSPARSETATYSAFEDAQMAAISAALQTRHIATVGMWTGGARSLGVLSAWLPLFTAQPAP
jgi:hypothetical protein